MKKNFNRIKTSLTAFMLAVLTVIMSIPVGIAADNSLGFSDVKEDDWFFEAVKYSYDKGYMSGVSKTSFSPKVATTRAMLIAILYRMEGSPVTKSLNFADVSDSKYFYSAACWASNKGVMYGYGSNRFGGTDTLTRQQMVTVLYRYAKLYNRYDTTATADLSGYNDYETVSSYALDAMSWAVAEGIIYGTEGNNLSPNGSATRAQIASILMRFEANRRRAEPIVAGTDSGLTRDGTPKKYFTLSFDDGITQDEKIIEILNKYNVDCCTFNINTGLYGANWEWVGPATGNPAVTHIRYTEEELRSGIYDGFDVEVHTLTHPSLKELNSQPERLIQEVAGDAANITDITNYSPVGMAWPGGDAFYDETTIEIILDTTDVRFARGTTSTYGFELPEYFMRWMPTCSIMENNVLDLARSFVASDCTEDMMFYVWGHGYEFDAYNLYDTFEELIKIISQDENIVLVTNAEFYQLFKDDIPTWEYA